MAIQESGEMYLETIYVLSKRGKGVRAIDVGEYMGFSKPSVSRAMSILKSGGYVETDEDGYLTYHIPEYIHCKRFDSWHPISAKTEEEISELDPDEQQMFLDDLGLKESGLNRLVKASYKLLGLISYLTAGEPETRAWTIKNGTKAPQAAGKIHTDFEKGFIRAEVVDYEILVECGNYTKAKELGKVRSEGKDYIMKDGDVVLFRFNV